MVGLDFCRGGGVYSGVKVGGIVFLYFFNLYGLFVNLFF